jgi:feruloyl-CoA synthase
MRDAVIAGRDRDEIGVLVFPDVEACRKLCTTAAPDSKVDAIVSDARVRRHFESLLNTFSAPSSGSSTRVCRILLLAEPPSIDAGEMTDKGSINQRAVLERRAALVEELYAHPRSPRVICVGGAP